MFPRPWHRVNAHRITKESWTPSRKDATKTFSTAYLAPGIKIALVHGWIDLETAFGQIQRCNRRMCQALESKALRLLIALVEEVRHNGEEKSKNEA
jgi:hypothetical protein